MMERAERTQLDPSLWAKLKGRQRWPRPSGSRAMRLTLGLALSILSVGVSILFGLVEFPRYHPPFQSSADPIYLEDPGYQPKGLPPTIDDLDFENDRSPDRLLYCLDLRSSLNPEDLKDAAACLRRILDAEGRNPSLQTRSHLVAALGEIYLKLGNYEEAAKLLEEARRHERDNDEAAVRLLRAYQALLDQYQEMTGPWSEADGVKVRRLLEKIEELEDELVRLAVRRMAAWSAPGAPDSPVNWDFVPVFLDFGPDHWKLRGPVAALWDGPASSLWHLDDCTSTATMDRCHRTPAADGLHLLPVPEPRARVVSIGVGGAGPLGLPPLRHAAEDARRIARSFEAIGFDPVELVDGNATRGAILWNLAGEVLASRPGDELVVYYSGHGFTDADGNGAVVTYDYDGDGRLIEVAEYDAAGKSTGVTTYAYDAIGNITGTDDADNNRAINIDDDGGGSFGNDTLGVLRLKELEAVLSHHRGKVTVIVDACLDERDVDLGNPVTGPVGATRPTFLLAAAPGEIAIESNRLGGGVFTHALDVYLAFLAADRDDGDGFTFDVGAASGFITAETTRLAMELHGVEQRPEVVVGVDRRP